MFLFKLRFTSLTSSISRKFSDDIRLSKVISQTGICSRREAERWIMDGRVRINFDKTSTIGQKISEKDKIFIDDIELRVKCKYERPRIWAVHKMRGELCTRTDPIKKRPVVFNRLQKLLHEEPQLIAINKLEFGAEGLLLLTNSSKLAKHMEDRSSGFERKYRIRVHGKVTPSKLDGLQRGLLINGVKYRYNIIVSFNPYIVNLLVSTVRPIQHSIDTTTGVITWMTVTCSENKVRNIIIFTE
jgi:23S rRNA pseudouridine2605 synthase